MSLSLRIIINEQGDTRDLELGETTTVGRSSKNRIQIQQGYISSEHAVITQNDVGGFLISDLDSKNGTFVNDEAVTSAVALAEGDVLRFGLAACQVVDTSRSSNAVSAQPPASPPVRMVIRGSRRPYLATSRSLVGKKPSSKASRKKTYLATAKPTRGRFGRAVYDPFSNSKVG